MGIQLGVEYIILYWPWVTFSPVWGKSCFLVVSLMVIPCHISANMDFEWLGALLQLEYGPNKICFARNKRHQSGLMLLGSEGQCFKLVLFVALRKSWRTMARVSSMHGLSL